MPEMVLFQGEEEITLLVLSLSSALLFVFRHKQTFHFLPSTLSPSITTPSHWNIHPSPSKHARLPTPSHPYPVSAMLPGRRIIS